MGAGRYLVGYGALCLLMVSFVCSGAQKVDVSGNWEGEIQTYGAKSLQKSIALSLEQAADGKVKGQVFYEDDGCIFAVEGQISAPGNNTPARVDLLEKGALTGVSDGCQHQRITYALGLTPTGNKLKVEGSHLSQLINPEKSFLTRQPENRFSERLKLIETVTSEDKRKPKQWSGAMNTTLLRFLFPAGYASPNHVYVYADQLTVRGYGKCKSSLYSQDGAGSDLKYISDDPECDILPAGHFDISAEDNLKITWRPKAIDAREVVLADQDISLVHQQVLTGEMWHLQDVYNKHGDSHTLSQIASKLLVARQNAYQRFNDIFAMQFPASKYSPEFIGSWEGFIRFSDGKKPDENIEQAALALWSAKSNDRSYILGYLTISEACFYSVYMQDKNGVAMLHGFEQLKRRCSSDLFNFEFPKQPIMSMDTSNTLLRIGPEVRPEGRKGIKQFQAVFHRAKPTPYLMSLLESDQGQSFALPDEVTKALMIAGKVPDENLEKQHDQRMRESAELLAKKAEQIRIQEAEAKQREWARLKKESEYRTAARQSKSGERAYASKPVGDPMPLPKVRGPFDGIPGATFLNAVYQGDRSVVQRINRSYTGKQAAGLKAFFGSYGNKMTDAMADLYKQVRIEDSVAAKYLFEYEKHYRRCLSESPAVFYVTGYQPDMVVTNLLGAEIARHYGGTTKTKYQVNSEFSDVFRQVGKMQPEGVAANITGFLASQSGEDLRKLSLNGVAQMFSKFSCDSPEVKTFEKNLIALF
ncbi:hypothetical protein [Lacimicrobium alkaliphilum]|uniref:Uncharacterized protein n=1 Tax=Lacimicrobium alkaliphilum TaxID=1526571 RepID=A0ABQ1RNN7_9ALTE|nr:hypothetical protein [Lacimicrobium alkaliphilum]GGD75267.1 hypothetical protein GCM10011357_32840 [Lacimicrobium alkaliphilum]